MGATSSDVIPPPETSTRRRWGIGCGCLVLVLGCGGLLLPDLPFRGITIAWDPILIRPATPADPVEDRYFTLGPKETAQFRNVVVAEGTFNKRTTLTVVLYIVQSGKVTELDFLSLCRSPNRFGEPNWLTMHINIALNDELKPEGRVTHLGASGQSRAFGGGGVEVVHSLDAVKSRVQSGDLVPGEFRIVYVEGDKACFLERSTTIEEFSQLNDGNYLVVAAGLNR